MESVELMLDDWLAAQRLMGGFDLGAMGGLPFDTSFLVDSPAIVAVVVLASRNSFNRRRSASASPLVDNSCT